MLPSRPAALTAILAGAAAGVALWHAGPILTAIRRAFGYASSSGQLPAQLPAPHEQRLMLGSAPLPPQVILAR
jgi:hypothetical protein